MTSDQKHAVHEALQYLADLDDDYGLERNGQGYNRDDSEDGHYWAGLDYCEISDDEWEDAKQMLRKYRRTQLPDELVEAIWPEEGELEVEV